MCGVGGVGGGGAVQQHLPPGKETAPEKGVEPPAKDATQVAGASGGGGTSGDLSGALAALTQALDGLKALLAGGTLGGGPGGKPGQVGGDAGTGVDQVGQLPPGKGEVEGEHGVGQCDEHEHPHLEPPGVPTQLPLQKGVEPPAKGIDPDGGIGIDDGPHPKGDFPGQVGGRHGFGSKPGWGHGGFGPPGTFGFPGQFPGVPPQKVPSQVDGLNRQLEAGLLALQQMGVNIGQGPAQKGIEPPTKVEADSGPGQKDEPPVEQSSDSSTGAVPSGSSSTEAPVAPDTSSAVPSGSSIS